MPIENERKYVLNIDTPENIFMENADSFEEIEQIYLMCDKKQSIRIRKSIIFKTKTKPEIKYTFTFKQDVNKQTVEIETVIDKKDYDMLSKEYVSKLKKIRYRLGNWEVDFFKKNDITYFVQAEIELPEEEKKPKEIPSLILQYIIHYVKKNDGRFSSKKLGDFRYAKQIMQTLLVEIQ